mgnify:FL=1
MIPPKKNEVRKPTRTISGITPVAIMLPPRKCKHGACVFCPNLNVPQSYTPKSPVVLRAKAVNYDSFKQVKGRMEAFEAMNHPTDKIEIIIMGGTFLEYPKKFQYDFVKGIYDALNGRKGKTLGLAKKKNEKAQHRCVALCIETRPDKCVKFILRMREFGCTRVELGVQIIDNKIYKKVQRGHSVQDVVDATKALRNAGFKVGYHLMPGLPGVTPKKDLESFKKVFADERFKPDQIKIYPCQVMPGSELENWYWKGKYKPYTKNQIQKLLVKMMKLVPRYCRVMRGMREIPPEYLVAGTLRIDLRREIEREMRENDLQLDEIRYREIGFALQRGEVNQDLDLKVTKYKAGKGDEYFLEIINKDQILFGLLRLRIVAPKGVPSKGREASSSEGKKAIIRELHVYGKTLALGKKGKGKGGVQHKGFGKRLMAEAEKIVREQRGEEVKVISGVGVREYYKKLGYKLDKKDGELMSKLLI